MKQPKTMTTAQELLQVRAKLEEVEQVYRDLKAPLEARRAELSEKLLEEMRKDQTLSTRYEDFTIARKKSTKAVVINEWTAIARLKETKPQYVIEAISPAALEEVKKGTLQIDGVQREEREYISITQKKINAAPAAETI